MNKKQGIFIEHISVAIEMIEKFTINADEKTFKADSMEQSAVIRQFEIIGEAAKNIPTKFRKLYPDVPWLDMCGMRDKLIHEYFGVDLNSVWKTVKNDLPVLKKQIEKILNDLEKSGSKQKKLL